MRPKVLILKIDRCYRVSDDGAGSQPSSDSEPAMAGHHHHHSSSSYRHHTHSRAAQQSLTTASQAAGQVTAAVVVHRSDKSSAASSSATGSGSNSRDQVGTAGVTLGPYDTIKPSRMRQQQKQLQQQQLGRSGSNGSGNNGNSVSWTLSNADPICRMGFVTHSLILFRIWMILKTLTVQSSQQTLPLTL